MSLIKLWKVLFFLLLSFFAGTLSGCRAEYLNQVPRDLTPGVVLLEKERLDDYDRDLSGYQEKTWEFAKEKLGEAEQYWYLDILEELGSLGEGVDLNPLGLSRGLTREDIDRIFQSVMLDHPELFYVTGYSYTVYETDGRVERLHFVGTYQGNPETIRHRKNEIEQAVSKLLEGVEPGADDYTLTKYVYDTIICGTDYSRSAPDNQNIYSVFVGHRSVCQGYAKATQYLLNRLGIPCTLVTGTVLAGQAHAWNLVQIDGAYYYLDTTWGDASYRGEEGEALSGQTPQINYDYLNITTEELEKTHQIDAGWPNCEAVEANYYYREDAVLTNADVEALKAFFESHTGQGKDTVAFRCANEECYQDIRKLLIENRFIFECFCSGGASVAYVLNDNRLSMTFWMTNE